MSLEFQRLQRCGKRELRQKKLLSTSAFSISVVTISPVLFSGGVAYDILFNLPFLINVLIKIPPIILSKLNSSCALAFLISFPCV